MTPEQRLLAGLIGASLIGGILIGLLLRSGPRGAGGSAVDLAAIYGYVKGRWPYILGVTSAAVVELHSQGLITDSQFKTLLALHAAGIGPALRGAIQHIVGDAVQKKVTVQIEQAKKPPVSVTPKRLDEPDGVLKEGM